MNLYWETKSHLQVVKWEMALSPPCAQTQGKQLDVVILSCVRAAVPRPAHPASDATSSKARESAGAPSSIGFVADVRRLNVAITRAKRALWVLGNCRALESNATWSALIGTSEEAVG